jgi:sec-independent protein translocase protein TatB
MAGDETWLSSGGISPAPGAGYARPVFSGLGWGEVVVLLVIGLFVFGPDKLPKAARDAGRILRQLRQMANGIQNDLRQELGPEFADVDLRDLHPKTFVRKHLLEDEEDSLFAGYLGQNGKLDLFGESASPGPSLTKGSPAGNPALAKASGRVHYSPDPAADAAVSLEKSAAEPAPWDTDAT